MTVAETLTMPANLTTHMIVTRSMALAMIMTMIITVTQTLTV